MNYTDEQLKAALAKMLPKKLQHVSYGREELLHLCWLVEKVLIENDKQAYNLFENRLFELCNPYTTLSATWQQRVAALAKVKGIEI